MIPILLLTFCLGIATAAPTFDHNLDAQWRQWKIKYGKIYRPYVETYKREVWEKNMKIIEQHNKEYREGKHSYTLGMNAFGDMTLQEYNKVLTGFQSQKLENGKVFQKTVFGDVPKFLDWSTKGYVNPVRDQGPCGSCWAFSASGALEGQLFRKTGKLISLSVQNLVDCSRPQGNLGCQGGLMPHAFQYIKDNGGLDTEKSYPYEAREGPCRYRPENSAINVTGFVQIPVDEKVLMNAVATVGPISVGVDANHVKFQFYKSAGVHHGA
uniref:procathepsin L-like isoform X2 n=1 Tax=Jaculus jaculus TaxID=51337 RepID=UPI001E1B2A8E|nr:procathepsin L-like isoform X2 [Jaculus jaculus]